MSTKNLHLRCQLCPFSSKHFCLKVLSTYLFFSMTYQKKKKKRQKPTTYVSNNDHIPMMKLIRELYES